MNDEPHPYFQRRAMDNFGGSHASGEKVEYVEPELGLREMLDRFDGSETYHVTHRAMLGAPRLVVTDGVKYLADKAQAYLLLDIIQSVHAKVKAADGWAIAFLRVEGSTAEFELRNDTGPGSRRLHFQEIPYTDFPLEGETKLYVSYEEEGLATVAEGEKLFVGPKGSRLVVILPGEY